MENSEYKFTRLHTQIAKGVAITLMMSYHLFAFPDRIQGTSYVSIMSYWLQSIFSSNSIEFFLSDFGKICVAMYLFLSGYGLYLSSCSKSNFTIIDSCKKMIKFLINYWTVSIIFVPIGFTRVFRIIGKADATSVDFILAPLIIFICTNFIVNNRSKNMFLILGKHSTNMWLTHSFFCYYYFQRFVFIPKLSILIVIWLAVLSLCSSISTNFVIELSSQLQEKIVRIKKRKVLT